MKIKHRTLEDFPAEQVFEVAATEGCINGNILVVDSLGVYFAAAQQPIYFVAADNIEGDSGYVRLRVGTEMGTISTKPVPVNNHIFRKTKQNDISINELREGYKQMLEDKRQLLNKNEAEKKEEELIEGLIIEACFTGYFSEIGYWQGDVLIKKDGCDEEIVVCDNYQPPKFEDVGTITVLSENDPWQWVDDQGNSQTTNTGTACDYKIEPDEFGKTYIMPKIGDFAPGNQVYDLLEDTKVTVCLDNNDPSDPIWRYSVENLRVPIFRDHCPAWPIANGFIDLEDGTNTTLLADNIKNCTDYVHVMVTLGWWWKGPYWQQGQTPPHKFYFSAGTIAHENVHVRQLRDGGTEAFPIASISKEMNGPKGLPSLVKYIYSAIIAKCPKDALSAIQGFDTMKERVKNQIKWALDDANELRYRGGVDPQLRWKSELEADVLARPIYDEIKTNIEDWAKQQSWWCIPWPIVGDDYYLGCDKSECTP